MTSGVRQSFRCPHRCLHSCRARQANYCISEVLNNARLGELDRGYAFAGSNTWRIERIMPVAELFSELKDGYARVARQNTVRLRDEFNRRLERLNALYDEYGLVLEKGIHSVRDEMGRAMERGLAAIGDEHRHTLERINQLKEEYAGQLEAAETLWLQLARYFDTSALLSPAPNQSA